MCSRGFTGSFVLWFLSRGEGWSNRSCEILRSVFCTMRLSRPTCFVPFCSVLFWCFPMLCPSVLSHIFLSYRIFRCSIRALSPLFVLFFPLLLVPFPILSFAILCCFYSTLGSILSHPILSHSIQSHPIPSHPILPKYSLFYTIL